MDNMTNNNDECARWKKSPWSCPQCEGEEVQIRGVEFPGGSPSNITRIDHISYDARCMQCNAIWRTRFAPESYRIISHGEHSKRLQN